MPPAARVVQIQRAIRRHFLINAHFHKQAAQDDDKRIRNQHPIDHRNRAAERNGNRLAPLARPRQRQHGVIHNILKRAVGNFIDGHREHAAAVRRSTRPAEGRKEIGNHVPFLLCQMQAFQRTREFRAQKRRDQTDHDRHPVMAENGLPPRALPIPARLTAKGCVNLLLFLLLHAHSPSSVFRNHYTIKSRLHNQKLDFKAGEGCPKLGSSPIGRKTIFQKRRSRPYTFNYPYAILNSTNPHTEERPS